MDPIGCAEKATIVVVGDTPDNLSPIPDPLKDTDKIKIAINGEKTIERLDHADETIQDAAPLVVYLEWPGAFG